MYGVKTISAPFLSDVDLHDADGFEFAYVGSNGAIEALIPEKFTAVNERRTLRIRLEKSEVNAVLKRINFANPAIFRLP